MSSFPRFILYNSYLIIYFNLLFLLHFLVISAPFGQIYFAELLQRWVAEASKRPWNRLDDVAHARIRDVQKRFI